MIININKVEKIEIRINKVNDFYEWKKNLKIFGITILKERYLAGWFRRTSIDESEINLEENFIKDKIVYFKPHVTIFLPDSCEYKYFEYKSQLDEWINKLTSKYPFLIVINHS